MAFKIVTLTTCCFLATIATRTATRESARAAAYEEFRGKYGRVFNGGADELSYADRRSLFEDRKAAVERHNAQPGISWEAGLNEFSDFTEEEFRSRLGYRTSSWRSSQSGAASSFLETRPVRELAETVDWSSAAKKMQSSSFLRNQGACGSCWAVAAVGALEMHAEMKGPTEQLSFEQLVDCVPNPKHCGGTGGCAGATAELGFQYVKEHGLSPAKKYEGYLTNGKEGKCKPATQERAVIDDFVQLPVNRLRDLKEAVHDKGPVVVSVDAGGWSMYSKGVFNGCGKDATVNHAVLLVGYGKDENSGKDHWLIRNSWGSGWGEKGHIRLERHGSDQGDAGHCGTDYKPQDGVGCDGGPKTLPVCGMCGILSDSSYPKGVRIEKKSTK